MANWAGILATVAGGTGEGGFKAWGKDIDAKRKESVEERKRRAINFKELSLARIKQQFAQENVRLGDTLASGRAEKERTFEAGESEKERSFKSGEGEKERKSKEKIALTRGGKETTADKKYKELQALKSVIMDLGAKGVPIQEMENGAVVAQIPTDEKGKPLDMSMLQMIDNAGLKFKTGSPVKAENNWFSPDVWVTDVYIGGMKSGKSGTGLLGGTGKPKKSEGTELSGLVRKAQAQTTKKGQSPTIKKEAVGTKGILTPEDTQKEQIPYHTSMTKPMSKEQEEVAIKELTDLAHKLGVGPGNWKALGELAKDLGGWAWESYQKAWGALSQTTKEAFQGQKEARKSLSGYGN